MKQSVRDYFVPFTKPLEGVVRWMYPDVKNLVSIGIGNLIDASPHDRPWSPALSLPFVRVDGTSATHLEIEEEWTRIKHLSKDKYGRTAAQLGHLYAMGFATLRLTDKGIDDLVSSKLLSNEAFLHQGFPEWESWPADAQLATHSMAWAVGAAFWQHGWPKLTEALRAGDFLSAAVECFMPEEKEISGLIPRNRANRTLYRNAHAVEVSLRLEGSPLDPEVIYFPSDLLDETPTTPTLVPIVHASPFQEPDPDDR